MRKFIIKDTEKNAELVLPVTPPSFEVSHGIKIETINIHKLGDVILPGYGTLPTIRIDCMFPAQKYSFNQPKTNLDPYSYIKKLEAWCNNHTILRFIVSNTVVNEQIIITDIAYGEKDGTGDVYATINIRGYRKLAVSQTNKTGNKPRANDNPSSKAQVYVIKRGDTLSALCRKFYGNASLYQKLAAYNGIKNADLIYAGNTLKIPDKKSLMI